MCHSASAHDDSTKLSNSPTHPCSISGIKLNGPTSQFRIGDSVVRLDLLLRVSKEAAGETLAQTGLCLLLRLSNGVWGSVVGKECRLRAVGQRNIPHSPPPIHGRSGGEPDREGAGWAIYSGCVPGHGLAGGEGGR